MFYSILNSSQHFWIFSHLSRQLALKSQRHAHNQSMIKLFRISHRALKSMEMKVVIGPPNKQMFIVNCVYCFGISWTQHLTTWADVNFYLLLPKSSANKHQRLTEQFVCTQ